MAQGLSNPTLHYSYFLRLPSNIQGQNAQFFKYQKCGSGVTEQV